MAVPYTSVSTDGDSESKFGDLPLSIRGAHYKFGSFAFGYGIYLIKPAGHHLHFIAELQGHTVLNGEDKMQTSFDAAGGVRIYPFETDAVNIGVGVKLPLDEDGYETLLSFMHHL